MQPGPIGYALHFQLVPATANNALVAADGSQLEALLGGVQLGTGPSANPVRLSLASTLVTQLLGVQGASLSSSATLDAYAQIVALLEARQTALEANVDASSNRVLGFSPQPTTNVAEVSIVLGAPDFNGSQAAVGASARSYIGASHVTGGGGRLVVCDQAGNRVLGHKNTPKYSNTPADLVLGQTDFAGTDAHAGAVAAATLNAPSSAWTDGVRLLVFDSGNNRVLLWNTFPTASGQLADVVLGQPDKTPASINAGGAVSASGLANGQNPISSPGVSSNGTQIAVADTDNNRVLIWDSFPTSDGRYVVVGDTGNQRYMVWDADT